MRRKTYYLEDDVNDSLTYLIALGTALEGFQLAHLLNQNLGTRFKRSEKDIRLPLLSAYYPRFEWSNENTGIRFDLFSNKHVQDRLLKTSGDLTLFDCPSVKEVYLLPDFKQVDFLIKVNDAFSNDWMKKKLEQLPQIAINRSIPSEKIKQLNLIFD